jgi:hypothetical protein
MKIINWILGLLFASFSYVNINDPDPWLWIAIYAAVSVIFILKAIGIYKKQVALFMAIALIAYSLFYVPYFIEYLMTPNKEELFGEMVYIKPYIEGTREFGGLVIAAIALLYSIKGTDKKST